MIRGEKCKGCRGEEEKGRGGEGLMFAQVERSHLLSEPRCSGRGLGARKEEKRPRERGGGKASGLSQQQQALTLLLPTEEWLAR